MPLIEKHFPGVPPNSANGSCYFCRTADSEEYVRTGVDIEWEGEIVICPGCAATVAQAIDWVSPQSVARLKGENKKLKDENIELRVVAAEHSALVSALNAAGVKKPASK